MPSTVDPMSLRFKMVSMYGGKLTLELPELFVDASDFRQVPDHQEVYVDGAGYTSVIVELNERTNPQFTEEEAIEWHMQEICDSTGMVTFSEKNPCHWSHLEGPSGYLMTISAPNTTAPGSPPSRLVRTGIMLLLYRSAKWETDLLVQINVPHYRGEYDEERTSQRGVGPLMDMAMEISVRILATLKVDWEALIATAPASTISADA